MDEADRKLLIDIHGTVAGIKPVLDSNVSMLKTLDDRQRQSDITVAQHGVKIERVETDLDNLGKKFRVQSDRSILQRRSDNSSSISSILNFLDLLPRPVKQSIVTVLLSMATTAAVILYKHWPR